MMPFPRVDLEGERVHVLEVYAGETRVNECLDTVQGFDMKGDEDWVPDWGPFLAEESGSRACAGVRVRVLEPTTFGFGDENICVDNTVVVDLQDGHADGNARLKRRDRQKALGRIIDQIICCRGTARRILDRRFFLSQKPEGPLVVEYQIQTQQQLVVWLFEYSQQHGEQ